MDAHNTYEMCFVWIKHRGELALINWKLGSAKLNQFCRSAKIQRMEPWLESHERNLSLID